MSRTHHPRKRTPPKRRCRECGGDVYSWTESPLCPSCVRDVIANPPDESIRDYLRRTGRLSPLIEADGHDA